MTGNRTGTRGRVFLLCGLFVALSMGLWACGGGTNNDNGTSRWPIVPQGPVPPVIPVTTVKVVLPAIPCTTQATRVRFQVSQNAQVLATSDPINIPADTTVQTTFNGVALGDYVVKVEFLDAASNVLATVTRNVTVTDARLVTITVDPVSIVLQAQPAALSTRAVAAAVPPRGSTTLAARGGIEGTYTWTISTNNSGGTIDPATGAYTAGPTANTEDVITVTDILCFSATASVNVGPGITIQASPNNTVPFFDSIQLTASGGSGTGYTWKVTDTGGGWLTDADVTPAGPGAVKTVSTSNPQAFQRDATVQVTDSLGNQATITLTMQPG